MRQVLSLRLILRYMLIVISQVILCACSAAHLEYKHHGAVRIYASPSEAYIYANGSFVGTSPLTLDLEIFQNRENVFTAIPIVKGQYRQDVIVRASSLPETLRFFMDIPSKNTTAKLMPPDNPNAVKLSPVSLIVPPTFYYPSNEHKLNDDQRKELKLLATSLSRIDLIEIRIFGYADEMHTDEFNKKLSIARSQYVYSQLIELGISSSKVKVYGFGEVQGRHLDFSKSELSENRKVNFEIKI